MKPHKQTERGTKADTHTYLWSSVVIEVGVQFEGAEERLSILLVCGRQSTRCVREKGSDWRWKEEEGEEEEKEVKEEKEKEEEEEEEEEEGQVVEEKGMNR